MQNNKVRLTNAECWDLLYGNGCTKSCYICNKVFRAVKANDIYFDGNWRFICNDCKSFINFGEKNFAHQLLTTKKENLEKLLSEFKFDIADKYFRKYFECDGCDVEKWYSDKISYYKEIQKVTLIKERIEHLASQFKFEAAKACYKKELKQYGYFDWYKTLIFRYRNLELLKEYNFIEADKISYSFENSEYEKLKMPYVRQWFEKCVTEGDDDKPYLLDEQQAMAVLNANKNTIVAARAGSGKTRTLVAKIIYLIAKYNVLPNEILAFVFNKDAANEINARLNKIKVNGVVLGIPLIACTFHSCAHEIVKRLAKKFQGEILQGRKRTLFIQTIIEKEIPKEKIYKFFRAETLRVQGFKNQNFANAEMFYQYLREQKYLTLDGNFVKSEAEKIIADYLFEHNIEYCYEDIKYPSSVKQYCNRDDREKIYQLQNKFHEDYILPDFYLKQYDIPWEHWAINGEEEQEEINNINNKKIIGDYNLYKEKMEWKQWFYKKDWLEKKEECDLSQSAKAIYKMQALLETYKPKGMNREQFENYIESKLHERGIDSPKLPEEELINKVWENQVKRFPAMIEQFIDRAQLNCFDDEEELEKRVKNYCNEDRVKSFIEIGFTCYKKYREYLFNEELRKKLNFSYVDKGQHKICDFSQYVIDYSNLLKEAIEIINSHNYETSVKEKFEEVKYILIDEYQDFSKLFFTLLSSIRNICPDSKLLVVGDDWQAINRFAGSDTDYFINFEQYFTNDNRRLEITTNYRSAKNIIKYSNQFVKNNIDPNCNIVEFANEVGAAGDIEINLNEYFDFDAKNNELLIDTLKKSEEKQPPKKSILYLKTISSIIHKNFQCNSIYLLHRNNETSKSFQRINIENLLLKIKRYMTHNEEYQINDRQIVKQEFDSKVKIMTMHTSKGLEADVVIILEADNGVIPMNHPNTELFSIFGENAYTSLEDQQRLFYVALTRAKNKLYVLHDKVYDEKDKGFLRNMENMIN